MKRIVPLIMTLVGICFIFWLIAVAINHRTDICYPTWDVFLPRLSKFSTVGNIEGIMKSFEDFGDNVVNALTFAVTGFSRGGDLLDAFLDFVEGIAVTLRYMFLSWLYVFALFGNIIAVPFEFLGLLFTVDEMFVCPVGGNPYPIVPIDTPMDSLFA